jgi:hypothetical protein
MYVRIEKEISKYGTMPEIKVKNPHLFSGIENLRLSVSIR